MKTVTQIGCACRDRYVCGRAGLLLAVVYADLEAVDEEDAEHDLEGRGVFVGEDDRLGNVLDDLLRPLSPDEGIAVFGLIAL